MIAALVALLLAADGNVPQPVPPCGPERKVTAQYCPPSAPVPEVEQPKDFRVKA